MGTSEALVGNLGPGYGKRESMWKFAIFRRAFGMAAPDPLPFAVALHRVFAHQAARSVETFVTAPRTEGVMFILDRCRKLAPTARVAAVMPGAAFIECSK